MEFDDDIWSLLLTYTEITEFGVASLICNILIKT